MIMERVIGFFTIVIRSIHLPIDIDFRLSEQIVKDNPFQDCIHKHQRGHSQNGPLWISFHNKSIFWSM